MPLQLAGDERVDDMVVVMTPTATIAGTIQDDRGRTVEGAEVQVWSSPRPDRRGLTDTGLRGRTDSLGGYRIEGLTAGRYYVSATGERAGNNRDEHVTTREDVDYAAGILARRPFATTPPAWAHVPVFYPGTTEAAGAQAITIASGDTREIDFTLRLVDLQMVSGTVRMPSGTPPGAFSVRLVPAEREMATLGVLPFAETESDGAFRIPNVTPGHYLLGARVIDGLSTALEGVAGYRDVFVGDADETDIVVELRPGATITGHVTIDGGPPTPGSELVVRPSANMTPIAEFSYIGAQAAIDDDGRFTLMNMLPGTYQLTVQVQQRSSPHIVVSQRVSGEETLDTGFEVAPGQQIEDVQLTVASAPAALSGVVRAPNGSPAANATIVMFPATASAWALKSPRMLSVQTTQSGRYEFAKVPPGEYLVSVADVAPADWPDDRITSHLIVRPTRTQLRSSETGTLDLVTTR
jgi:protocatechuate 3,4-dioxygenase beta subunit